jgi:hypothetical protein
MNRDFEFKQLLRAYRAGIITEETFESEMGAMESGNGNGNRSGEREFRAMGQTFGGERQAVDAMLDRFRAGEANGEAAFLAWAKLCTTDCIRSGIRMIAEREGYHARIFERRMRDLGLECKATVTDASRKITDYLADANVSDNQKLLYLTALAPDIDTFFKPITDLAENIKDDLESKELFKLFVQDELSSAKWLQYACQALNGAVTSATQSMSAQSGPADSLV